MFGAARGAEGRGEGWRPGEGAGGGICEMGSGFSFHGLSVYGFRAQEWGFRAQRYRVQGLGFISWDKPAPLWCRFEGAGITVGGDQGRGLGARQAAIFWAHQAVIFGEALGCVKEGQETRNHHGFFGQMCHMAPSYRGAPKMGNSANHAGRTPRMI